MTTIINSSYLNSPMTVAQGGTGQSSLTAYSLLAAGTTTTGAIQNAGTGTSNQIYVSAGSSSLGAWTNENATGTWQLVGTQTASTSASLAFTGLSTSYNAYKFILYAIRPASNSDLLIQVSSDNGMSYHSGGTDYFSGYHVITDSNSSFVGNSNNSGILLDIAEVATNNVVNQWEVTMNEPDTSIASPGVYFVGRYDDHTRGTVAIQGAGRYNGTIAVNAVQFLMSSGNITSGTIKAYGLLT